MVTNVEEDEIKPEKEKHVGVCILLHGYFSISS